MHAPAPPRHDAETLTRITIDEALQLVYSDYHRLSSRLVPGAAPSLTLEQLRAGPLGTDLQRLAAVAAGERREPREAVLAAVESVVQLLFWPAGADDYVAPRSFWSTALGRLLAMAKYRAFDADDLVSIGAAAERLSVSRPTIYRWIDDRSLDAVRDGLSGRMFVLSRAIDQRQRSVMAPIANGYRVQPDRSDLRALPSRTISIVQPAQCAVVGAAD